MCETRSSTLGEHQPLQAGHHLLTELVDLQLELLGFELVRFEVGLHLLQGRLDLGKLGLVRLYALQASLQDRQPLRLELREQLRLGLLSAFLHGLLI